MVQYQITAILNGEDELEKFVVGQRLAKDESKRLVWERHFREAEKKLEQLKLQIEQLKNNKKTLQEQQSKDIQIKLPTSPLQSSETPVQNLQTETAKNSD